ncbi:hypothetical protein HOLleu_31006 [Holothuria leucospilota]|uniref:Uncharacterized protein n=1 Tax=Holothuria leucospilota TaxID=206669 RepID=A0A9Q1H1L5_HOLLE|nr:hypothetical protein HOLleu_31006 [Holothuria leucospilota]
MTSFLELLLQMFIETFIIWIWEWIQGEKEEDRTNEENEERTNRNRSLRKIMAHRRRCNEKKLLNKQLKLLISFVTKIQQRANSDSSLTFKRIQRRTG